MYLLVLVLLIGLVGCSDDDNGGPAPPTTGRVMINPQPEGIAAPWSIAGPDGYAHADTGRVELTGRVPGDYTVTWGDVDGYVTPSSQTQPLAAGETVTFMGVYTADEDPTPPPGFVHIPPGTFTMGSPEDEPGRWEDEGPQHQVTLTRGFFMSQYEVTEEWWNEVMGGAPTTSQLPKRYVSWDMAVQFCNALSVREGLTPAYEIHGPHGDVTWDENADGYRLPTEAEWEYACRATTTAAYHNNTNCLDSTTEANFDGRSHAQLPGCPTGIFRDELTAVGSFPSNQWGLYDMHGSLWEWVWCGERTYTTDSQSDPVQNVVPGVGRVLRGGAYNRYADNCRSAKRRTDNPDNAGSHNCGFRLVRSAF